MKRTSAFAVMVAAALTLCAWGTAWAQDRAGTFTLSPSLGGYVFEGDERLDTSVAYGATLGYNVDNNLGVEFGFSFIDSGDGTQDVGVYLYHVDGVYHFAPIGKLQPYVAGGVGGITFDYDVQGPSGTALAFDWGGGAEYFVMDNLAVRADARHLITTNGGFSNLMFSGGVTVFFGVHKASVAR